MGGIYSCIFYCVFVFIFSDLHVKKDSRIFIRFSLSPNRKRDLSVSVKHIRMNLNQVNQFESIP